MAFKDRLLENIPKNEQVVLLRRKKRELELEEEGLMTVAKKRLLQSAIFGIAEGLLDIVEGSVVSIHEERDGSRVTLNFDWDRTMKIEDSSEDVKVFEGKMLSVVASDSKDRVFVVSREYCWIVPTKIPPLPAFIEMGKRFEQGLDLEEWQDKKKFEEVVLEALGFSGLTQNRLRQASEDIGDFPVNFKE